jgi:hypothetical protein
VAYLPSAYDDETKRRGLSGAPAAAAPSVGSPTAAPTSSGQFENISAWVNANKDQSAGLTQGLLGEVEEDVTPGLAGKAKIDNVSTLMSRPEAERPMYAVRADGSMGQEYQVTDDERASALTAQAKLGEAEAPGGFSAYLQRKAGPGYTQSQGNLDSLLVDRGAAGQKFGEWKNLLGQIAGYENPSLKYQPANDNVLQPEPKAKDESPGTGAGQNYSEDQGVQPPPTNSAGYGEDQGGMGDSADGESYWNGYEWVPKAKRTWEAAGGA